MNNKIYLSSPHMSGEEMRFVQDAFNSNWIAPLGPNVDRFEDCLSKYLNVKNVAVLISGTAAIHLALIILGVQEGDEVLVSTFTFSASVNPIIYQKATPVFIDSEEETWNMDPFLLEEAIKSSINKGKKPKAIILVQLYGMPSKIDDIMDLSRKYEIPIIEDAAEALGSTYKGKKLGSFGDFGILSFNGNKIITTSGGGALISNNELYIKKARFLATQARDDAPHYQHSEIGYNYRMSNVLAGIGLGQLKVLTKRVEQHRKNHNEYTNFFRDISGVEVFHEPDNRYYSNHWLTCILVDSNRTKNNADREVIRLGLMKQNVESRPLWKPMHLQPIFRQYEVYSNGISEKLFDMGLCLPSGSNMSIEDKARVFDILEKILK